jgi:hypothetical protein
MKAKKLMRWILALTLTGACAAAAVMTLDAWTGTGATARPAAGAPVVTTPVPAVASDAAPPRTDPGAAVPGAAMSSPVASDPTLRSAPAGPLMTPRPAGADTVMLPAASPVPGGEGRLLEQIETARAGLLAAQSTVPARPSARAAWIPVVFLAGGGGLIGCALGLGLGSLLLRKRRSAGATTDPAAMSSRELPAAAKGPDRSADAVLRVARAELAARSNRESEGSPAMSAAPGVAARLRALSRLAAADELAAPPPVAVAAEPPRAIEERAQETDPVDRRIAALERSLLQVVRAMEEVADRVTQREMPAPRPAAPASPLQQGGVAEAPGSYPAGALGAGRYAEEEEGSDREGLAPPMRAPRRHERAARPRAAGTGASPAKAPSPTQSASRSAAAVPRSIQTVGRAVRALRAAQDQASVAPEPWDLAPAPAVSAAPRAADRHDPASSIPSASTVDGRDLVRIRRAVLRLAAEGWDGGRIASRLRLGEGDVALILKTAGAEKRLQPVGQER